MDKFCFNCKNCTYDEDEDKYYCDLFGRALTLRAIG